MSKIEDNYASTNSHPGKKTALCITMSKIEDNKKVEVVQPCQTCNGNLSINSFY